ATAEPEPARRADATDQLVAQRRRGTSPLWPIAPLGVIIALLGAVYLPTRRAAPTIARVHIVAPKPESVVRLDPGAPELHAVEPLEFAFATEGKVAELLPPGQAVKSGDVLAKLDGYVKIERQLAELRSRQAFYENELDKAERAHNQAALDHSRKKV